MKGADAAKIEGYGNEPFGQMADVLATSIDDGNDVGASVAVTQRPSSARRFWGRSGLGRLHRDRRLRHAPDRIGRVHLATKRPDLTDAGIDIRVTRHRCKLGWLVETVLRWGGTVPTRKFLAPQLNALAQVGL